MHRTLFIIIALSSLVAGCSGAPSGSSAGSAASRDPSLSITSYQSGYGVRPNGPQSAADSQMDWGL